MKASSIPGDLTGTFVVLVRLFFDPISTSRAILHRSRWWAPLVLVGALEMIGAAVWLQHADPFAIFAGDGTLPVTFQSTGPDMAHQLRRWLLFGQALRWTILSPLVTTSVGAVCFVCLFLFTGVPPAMAKCVSVVTHAFCAGDLARLLLGLLVSTVSSDWRVVPADTAVTDLSLLLGPASGTQPLGCLLAALDLLTFWKLWISSVGLGVAGGVSTRQAASLVFGGWVIYAVCKALIVCI